ncbi:hypothetical protein ACHQM5_016335 [Ranunculus cassubicifolius]
MLPNNSINNRRSNTRPVPTTTTFRLLIPTTTSSSISGTIIKLLEQQTTSKIRLHNNTLQRCEERIITITGPNYPTTKITLNSDDDEVVEVSPVQHGLIKVVERLMEAQEEIVKVFPKPGKGNNLVCLIRLLADNTQIGYLMGKRGKRINQIELDCKAKLRVSKDLPQCASANDELIQISGDSLALKKAVLVVSQCLQDSPPLEQTFGSKPLMEVSENICSDPYASRSYSVRAEEEIVFRLVCSNNSVGGVIGKGASIVKALEEETGASIRAGASSTESDDRVIHISAMEKFKSRYSPAQNAVKRVFDRSVFVGGGRKLDAGSVKDLPQVAARLLVPEDQIGCLIGVGGAIISEMRKATRTSMWILHGDQVPPCAAENDAVLQISGSYQNVQDALFLATGKLRSGFFPNMMVNPPGACSSVDLSLKLGRQAALTENTHHLGHSNSMTTSGTAVVTNTTLEILVAEHVLGFSKEEKERNLDRMRQISGAKVVVNEPFPGERKATVIVSGTPEQTQAAQSVLQALIISQG